MSALEAEMSKLAASLVGEVMVLEIAQKVGSWLAWKAKGRGPRFGSFYEEMEAEKVCECRRCSSKVQWPFWWDAIYEPIFPLMATWLSFL